MKELKLANISNMTKKELKWAIENCFEYAPDASPVDRLAILQEAQFYTRELERRSDSLVSIRDLFLECVVIGLIGWEIWMGYQQEHNQAQNFSAQQTVLEHMQTSSQATADSLVAVNGTMKSMQLSLQKQVELFYDVQINVVYNRVSNRLVLINTGRSNVTIWAERLADHPEDMIYREKPMVLAPASTFEVSLLGATPDKLKNAIPQGQIHIYNFTFFIKNEKQNRFTISGELIAGWKEDQFDFSTQPNDIVLGWIK